LIKGVEVEVPERVREVWSAVEGNAAPLGLVEEN